MLDQVLTLPDGRKVGFNDYNEGMAPSATPVIYCHGGPGCRILDNKAISVARGHNLRIVAIDRPGYGLSSLKPGAATPPLLPFPPPPSPSLSCSCEI